eukprot:753289-Hanusia_phi.AAC.4
MLSSERSKVLWPDFDDGHAGAQTSTPPHTSIFSIKSRQTKSVPALVQEALLTSKNNAPPRELINPSSIPQAANEARVQPTQIKAEPAQSKNDKKAPKSRTSLSDQVVKMSWV